MNNEPIFERMYFVVNDSGEYACPGGRVGNKRDAMEFVTEEMAEATARSWTDCHGQYFSVRLEAPDQ